MLCGVPATIGEISCFGPTLVRIRIVRRFCFLKAVGHGASGACPVTGATIQAALPMEDTPKGG